MKEPVAWMQMFEDGEDRRMSLDFERIGINDIPLYTAPRELSYEEIKQCAIKARLQFYEDKQIVIVNIGYATEMSLQDFARAILKKASE